MARTALAVTLLAVSSLTASTLIGGDIHEITFEESAGPFVVEQDALVPAGSKVVMQPGTVLLFKPFTGLRVDGELMVAGTAEKPVVFTSVHDSRYGQGTGQLPNAVDWNGVHLSPRCTGARLTRLHLMYSVYGLKSQIENPQLQDCVFEQNGQFHFTINDKIQYVQDKIPFSNVSGAPAAGQAMPQSQAKPAPDGWAPKVEETPHGLKAFRYVSLGTGLMGAGLGTYFAIKASRAADDRDALGTAGSADAWDKATQDYEDAVLGSSVSFGLGGLLLVGCAITLFF